MLEEFKRHLDSEEAKDPRWEVSSGLLEDIRRLVGSCTLPSSKPLSADPTSLTADSPHPLVLICIRSRGGVSVTSWETSINPTIPSSHSSSTCHPFMMLYFSRAAPKTARKTFVSSAMSTLAPGQKLRGAKWEYQIIEPLKGDDTHISTLFKARILPNNQIANAPIWSAI